MVRYPNQESSLGFQIPRWCRYGHILGIPGRSSSHQELRSSITASWPKNEEITSPLGVFKRSVPTCIEYTEILNVVDLKLPLRSYKDLQFELETTDLPELSLFNKEWLSRGLRSESDKDVLVPRFIWWQGKNSLETLPILVTRVLPRFSGYADIVIHLKDKTTYYRGFRLQKGTVTEHSVGFVLGDRI